MAPPTKLTRAVERDIARLVRAGIPYPTAATLVGIGERTIYRWLERGHEPGRANAMHRRFRAVIERARAEAQFDIFSRMVLASQRGSWKAAAWLLERQYPDRYHLPTIRRRLRTGTTD
jgi:transposase